MLGFIFLIGKPVSCNWVYEKLTSTTTINTDLLHQKHEHLWYEMGKVQSLTLKLVKFEIEGSPHN